MKLYIISNRLPVKAVHRDGAYLFTRSEGGLATGLHALHTRYEKHWIGWPGVDVETDEDRRSIREELAKMNFHPIFLTPEQIANYYEGYSNSTIWPLCHYFFAFTRYRKDFWEAYRKVNALFCEEILRRIEPDDIVWVQDYQLMLLPGLLREHRPALRIGYFHHIPFPSYELFRILPERAEILRGVLGADLVAFHTHDYMRHFIGTAERVLHIDFRLDETQIGNRCVRVDALPMGIDYAAFHGISSNAGAQPLIAKTREQFGDRKLILSVDRLDYSKGILHRLRGFGSFLERYPEYRGQATLAMVIVPSRDRVNSYADLKTEIDKEIGAINGRYSTMEWTPVRYFYHGFSFEELAAMYYVADVALVTPLRDGMNLVAKEYVAVKNDNPGVLILSEMAGAAVELADALPINPNDTEQIAAAIHRALTMPVEEQLRRIERMQAVVSTQTVNKWAADFMKELADVAKKYGKPRRCEIMYEVPAVEGEEPEQQIPDYPVHLFFTRDGYFKKITPQSLRMSGEQKLKDGDEVLFTCESTNSVELLFFTNHRQVYKSHAYDFNDSKASVLGDYVASALGMEEGEVPLYMVVTPDYKGWMLFFYDNGKCAKVPLSSYETKQNRRKLLKAYSDKAELAFMRHLPEETELAIFTTNNRLLLVGSALIPEKTTRDTAGVSVVALKKNAKIARVTLAEGLELNDAPRYRVRTLPAAGAILKDDDRAEQLTL